MIPWGIPSMETLFLEVLNSALTATWIMTAVILLRALLKKRIPRRLLLWGWVPVVVRLLCPFSVESALSLIPSAKPIPLDIPYANTPALDLGVPVIEKPINDFLAGTMTPAVGESINPLQVVTAVAAILWVVGVVGLLVYTAVSWLLLRRRVRTATRAEASVTLPRRATLWHSERVESPFIFGVIRPRIYLPYGLDPETVAHVLSHESAHLKRLDHVSKLVAFLVCAVFWFHPLVWVCYVLYGRDMEAACDERVVRDLDDANRRAYARALLACAGEHHRRPFCPPSFGETDVKSRVKGILSYKKPLLWVMIAAVAAIGALSVFLLTDPAETYENIPSDWYGISHVTETVCDQQGFTMTPEDFVWEKGRITGLRMRYENHTSFDIGYGEPFRLERDEGGQWEDTAMGDVAFHLPEYVLPPDGAETKYYDLRGYDLSVHARYRFTISINVHSPNGTTEGKLACIYFTVAGGEALAGACPDDFAIRFEWQLGDVPSVLDTFDGYVQKDMVTGYPKKVKTDYTPTEAERQYLWYLVETYGVTSMPVDMHPLQLGDTHVAVTPNTEYVIRIRANGYEYVVKGDSVTGMTEGAHNRNFKAFVGEMYYFITSTGQWKSLPEANGGYD